MFTFLVLGGGDICKVQRHPSRGENDRGKRDDTTR
jgi:hypothetical protein